MLKAIKNLYNHKPKGGFRGWTYPGTTYKFNDDYTSIVDLANHVKRFELANDRPAIKNLEDVLEDYFCKTCSFFGQFCSEVGDGVSKVTLVDQVRRVISGAKAVVEIKRKSASKEKLKVLPLEKVAENVKKC